MYLWTICEYFPSENYYSYSYLHVVKFTNYSYSYLLSSWPRKFIPIRGESNYSVNIDPKLGNWLVTKYVAIHMCSDLYKSMREQFKLNKRYVLII